MFNIFILVVEINENNLMAHHLLKMSKPLKVATG